MKILNFTTFKLLLLLVIGILIGHYKPIPVFPTVLFTCLCFLVLIIFIFIKRQDQQLVIITVLFLTTVLLGVLGESFRHIRNIPFAITHSTSSPPELRISVYETLKPSPYQFKYVVKLYSVNTKPVRARLLLNVRRDQSVRKLKPDEEFLLFAHPVEISGPKNPHSFDYKAFMQNKNISYQLFCHPEELYPLGVQKHTLRGLANRLRNSMMYHLDNYSFGSEEKAIIGALLLGLRQEISPEVYNHYKRAGAVHILAISGLHIGVLLIFLNCLFYPFLLIRHGKKIRLLLVVLFLWGFALLSGLSASVVRAVTMFSFLAYAFYLNRPVNMYHIMALSMFFLLLFNPHFIFDVGFQLSYAAVFSIISIQPLLMRWWSPRYYMLKKIWQLLSTSIAAQIGVLPLTLYYFHQFPALFFISNLVIIPFLGAILCIGIFVIILALLNILPQILASFLNAILHGMNVLVQWISKIDSLVFADIYFNSGLVLCYFAFLFYLVQYACHQKRKYLNGFFVFVLCFQGILIYGRFKANRLEKFIVFHQQRHQILGWQDKGHINIYTSCSSRAQLPRFIGEYMTGANISRIQLNPPEYLYYLQGKSLLVVDSLGIYKIQGLCPEYVLLSYSPKIHLKRLINRISPKMIIADGSNYKSYVARWKQTCKEEKIPFHYTGEKGAFIIDIKN